MKQMVLLCFVGLSVLLHVASSAESSCCPKPSWIRLTLPREDETQPVNPKRYCITGNADPKHPTTFLEFELPDNYNILRFKFVRKCGELEFDSGAHKTYFGPSDLSNAHNLGMIVADENDFVVAPNNPLTAKMLDAAPPGPAEYTYPDYRFTQFLQSYELPVLPVGLSFKQGDKIKVTHASITTASEPETGVDEKLLNKQMCFDVYILAYEREAYPAPPTPTT